MNLIDVFLQSFYSTVFVNQTDTGAGGHNLEYMENSWLFFAVSIPLTLFTIILWYTWSRSGAIFKLFARKRENDALGIGEKVKLLTLLRRRRELPR